MRAPYNRRPTAQVTEQLDVIPTDRTEPAVETETLIYSDDFQSRLALARAKRAQVLSARNASEDAPDIADEAAPAIVTPITVEAPRQAAVEPAPRVEFTHRPYRRSFEPLADTLSNHDLERSFNDKLSYPQGVKSKVAKLRRNIAETSRAGGAAVAGSLTTVSAKAGTAWRAVPSADAIRSASSHAASQTRAGLGAVAQKATRGLPSGQAVLGGFASGLGQVRSGTAHVAGHVGTKLSGVAQACASLKALPKWVAVTWTRLMAPNLPYRAVSVAACSLIGLGVLVWHFPVPSGQALPDQQASAVIDGTIDSAVVDVPVIAAIGDVPVVDALVADVPGAQAPLLDVVDRAAPRLASTPRIVIARDQRTPVLPGAGIALSASVMLEDQLERSTADQIGPVAVGSPAASKAWVPAPEFASQTTPAVSVVSRSQFAPGALPNSTVVNADTPRLMSPDARPIFKSLRPTPRPASN